MSVNKVILIGRLGQAPEVRYTPSGAAVANFSVATNESWNDKNGQKQERTEWHRVVVWGKLAELCQQYLQKGRQVYLEGRLQTRQYQDKDGQTKYSTEIQAQTVQFLGAQGASAGGPSAGGANPNAGAGAGSSYGAGSATGASFGGGGASFGGAPTGGAGGQNGMSGPAPSSDFGAGGPSFTEDDIPF